MSIIHPWLPLALSLVAFVLSHLVPALPAVRTRLIRFCGRRTYFLVYGVTSLALLLILIAAAASAPYVEIWPATEQLFLMPRVVMPAAVVLAIYGLGAPNPLSLTLNRRGALDSTRPGVVGVTRHPVLWSMLVWSASHIVANGDVAHVVLFGTFGAMSVSSMVAIDQRRQASLGILEWRRLSARAPALPLLPSLLAGWRPKPSWADVLPCLIGLLAFALLAVCHGWFAGVPAYP